MYQQQDVENKKLEEEVSTILRDLGIPTNLSGYHYLITSILLGIEDFNNILNISSKLYPLVKEKHSISLSTLDKALRNAIEISFKKGNKAMIKKIFGYSYSKEKGKATESEFIAAIADTTILNKNNNDLEKKVSTILRNLGIPSNIRGYHYLRYSILLGLKDLNNVLNSSNRLYSLVANKYCIPFSKVERPMRYAIDISFTRGNLELQHQIFGYSYSPEKGKAINSEFIAAIIDNINLDINNDDLEKKVSTILRNLGVPLNIRGYYYLRTLILLYIKNANCVPNILHGLYTMVAEEYNTSTSRLQRSISYAIELSFVRGNSDLQEQIFNCSSKPSNLKFIVDVSSYLS